MYGINSEVNLRILGMCHITLLAVNCVKTICSLFVLTHVNRKATSKSPSKRDFTREHVHSTRLHTYMAGNNSAYNIESTIIFSCHWSN